MRAEQVNPEIHSLNQQTAKSTVTYPVAVDRPNYALFSLVFDMAMTIIALFVAELILQIRMAGASATITPEILAIEIGVWVATFFLMSVYDTGRNQRLSDEVKKVAMAVGLAALVFMGVLYITYIALPRTLIVSLFLIDLIVLVSWRVAFHAIHNFNAARNPVGWQRVLIVGANDIGMQVADIIQQSPWSHLEVFGFLDNINRSKFGDLSIVGRLNDVDSIIQNNDISEVVIALPHNQYDDLNQIIANLQLQPVQIRMIPSYLSLALYQNKGLGLNSLPLINLNTPALSGYQRMAKRAFDLIVASLTTLMILPVMTLVAIIIKLDSPGPVFFRQERIGEHGRSFKMYKFRSMVVNAEALQDQISQLDEYGNIIHKVRNDPRVTRVGRIIRKTSLDELPQFLNVIKGEMSLVGPRPELPKIVAQYQPWQRQRFIVPQGITGWWQINGRSDKPCHLNTDEDLYYIKNYSFWLDIQILFKTIPALLRGKGAF
jgi:exopolysaccharide biosynthesis polyprenyl glycosylphosphotransferase